MGRPRELLNALGRTLYLRPSWDTRVALARHLHATPSAIDPRVSWLSFHRALRLEEGRLTVDRPRLLTILTVARITHLRPADPFTTTLPPAVIHQRLQAAGIPHVFGFFTAANQWAFFEERRDVQLYVDRGRVRTTQRLLRQETPIRERPHLVQLFAEPLRHGSETSRGGLPITELFHTVIDLRAHPEGGAHADFLEKNTLPRLRDKDVRLYSSNMLDHVLASPKSPRCTTAFWFKPWFPACAGPGAPSRFMPHRWQAPGSQPVFWTPDLRTRVRWSV